jgi:predicted glycosyltransferase
MHRNWVNQFSGVWIFDNEQERLAGELSTSNEKSIYIGHYSRFQLRANVLATIPGKKVAIISGPEPYNKQLLDLITKLSTRFATKITIVCPELMVTVNDSTIDYIHDWLAADSAILAAEWVISRNGYSTLMDIKQLQKKALLLATPGQLEQVYFAELNNFSQQGVHQVLDKTEFEKQWNLLFNHHTS